MSTAAESPRRLLRQPSTTVSPMARPTHQHLRCHHALIAILLGCRSPAPAPPPLTYTLTQTFGQPLSPAPGVFNLPSGVAVDSRSGEVFVADTLNRRVQRFTADGTFLSAFDTLPAMGLTVDPIDDTILVTAPGHKQVIRYSRTGEELGRIGGDLHPLYTLDHPVDVAVLDSGLIAVLSKASAIVTFDRGGQPVDTWLVGPEVPTRGAQRSVDRAFGIAAVPGGGIAVANSGLAMISRFTESGTLLARWGGTRGSEPGVMRWNRGIAVAADGRIYTADTDNERVQAFSPDGTFLAAFRGPHDGDAGIFHPRSLDVNTATGEVYVTASYAHRVDRFSADGTFLGSLGTPRDQPDALNDPRGIAVDPDSGRVFVSSRRDHAVVRFSAEGTVEKIFRLDPGITDPVDDSWSYQAWFQFPGPIELGLDRTLWTLRQGYHYPDDPTPAEHLRRHTQGGRFLSRVGHEALVGYVTGLAIHPGDGAIFLTIPKTGELLVLSAEGEERLRTSIGGKPTGIAIDPARQRLYIADEAEQLIGVYDLTGQRLSRWGIGSGLADPTGVEVDDCGRVLITDHDRDQLLVLSPTGEVLARVPIGADPWDLEVIGDRVWVVSDDGQVRVLTRGGACSGL